VPDAELAVEPLGKEATAMVATANDSNVSSSEKMIRWNYVIASDSASPPQVAGRKS
jgi:hypothetical protein